LKSGEVLTSFEKYDKLLCQSTKTKNRLKRARHDKHGDFSAGSSSVLELNTTQGKFLAGPLKAVFLF
jgi:hypothetical protein